MTPPPQLREALAVRGDFTCHELTEWAGEFGLAAGITSRGADFGLSSAEPTGLVLDRWRRLRLSLRPAFHTVIVAHQCHGTALATHQARGSGWQVEDDTDGHLTAEPGLLLAVMVADCVPVYLTHGAGRWIALLHAGWRGIAAGIVEQGIARLAELANCRPGDIVIHCGVSICHRCYEVGPEVYEAVTGGPAAGQGHLDLRALVAERAERSGVRRVTVSPWCSAHDQETFYSHRRSGGTDGRMVAYLGRPSP